MTTPDAGIWDTWYGGAAWTMEDKVAMVDHEHDRVLEGPFMIFWRRRSAEGPSHPLEQACQWLLI